MCCSRACLACSDFTRASFKICASRLYSSFGELGPILWCSFLTVSENSTVATSYSRTCRVFFFTTHNETILGYRNEPPAYKIKAALADDTV